MGSMTEHLFVYGTLAPGQPNERELADITGSWQPATVRGTLHPEGWGASLGYPAIVLDDAAGEVAGFVFSSEELSEHWARLDAFEGDAYERVLAKVELAAGGTVQAHVYALRDRRWRGRSRGP